MPTGYTADVQNGKVTEFSDFAWKCARNFGALIMMRDAAWDTPVPARFEPPDYHLKRLDEVRSTISTLTGMSDDEVAEACARDYAAAVATWEERQAERAIERGRYEAMLTNAREWLPPTPDHQGLKDFMISQLEESIRFDTSSRYDDRPGCETPSAYRARRLSEAHKSLAYHADPKDDSAVGGAETP